MMRAAIATAALVLAGASGCEGKGHAKVDGVLVPQARSVIDAPEEGATVHLPDDDLSELPDADVIKIAADRDVPWKDVEQLIERIEEAGKQPVPLVGKRWHVHGFRLSDPVEGPTIAVTAIDDPKDLGLQRLQPGRPAVCVAAPGIPDGKCAQTMSKGQVDRAHTRRLVREAVQQLKLFEADLEIRGDMSWANVVRAIDGVRTCCLDRRVAVKLNR